MNSPGVRGVVLRKSGGALPTRSGLPGCRDNAVTNTKRSTHGLDKGRQ